MKVKQISDLLHNRKCMHAIGRCQHKPDSLKNYSIVNAYKYTFDTTDNIVCSDVDECSVSQPCNGDNMSGRCLNHVGFYTCVCKEGFAGADCLTGRYVMSD